MNNSAPEPGIVKIVAEKYLNHIISVDRVPKGRSTFVYRVVTKTGTFYIRFLPENASFAAEVLALNMLHSKGVRVPRVLDFEHKNDLTGLSVMLVDKIPGTCIEDDFPQLNLQDILREAGRQLALIHTVPVDGFGWIDKSYHTLLKGEKQSFGEYFCEHLNHDLQALCQYSFSQEEMIQVADYMTEAMQILNVENSVLVHGDFDISHIFHSEGKYTGIIDFGEIRGNNPLFDLATFVGFYQDRRLYSYLLEGYSEVLALTEKDLYAVDLIALFIILRFLGKAVNAKSREHWFRLLRTQLVQVQSKQLSLY